MAILIKKTDTFTLEHDLETNSILHTIQRFLVTEEWQDLLSTGHEYCQENELSKWISDNRKLSYLHSNINDWLYDEWLPNMIEIGWKQWALVQPYMPPAKIKQRVYAEEFSKMGVEVKSFSCLNQAKTWIK